MSNATEFVAAGGDDVALIEQLHAVCREIRSNLHATIVGQDEVLQQLLVALFAQGHCLLVGVPGLAKTQMVHALADCLDLEFRRIQFTPDLMPSDITGTEVIQQNQNTGERELRFVRGPLFANVVLADEINRTPPKTQAALLEAMQERFATSGGVRRAVPEPFLVLATRNPIEQEGTYPLPEAQLDRFLLEIDVSYPSEEEELAIVERTTTPQPPPPPAVLPADQLLQLIEVVRRVPVAQHVSRYAIQLTRRSRPALNGYNGGANGQGLSGIRSSQTGRGERTIGGRGTVEEVQRYVEWGAGPRGSQSLVLAAKAQAATEGRIHVARDDIAAVARPALRHRLRLNYAAHADGVTTDDVIDALLDHVDRFPS